MIGTALGGLTFFLAALFALQASRIRFVFDETSFELKKVNDNEGEDELRDSGENVVVGGANRWDYDTFVNWDFFPNVDYPILVYFKETQTSSVRKNFQDFLQNIWSSFLYNMLFEMFCYTELYT